MVPNRQVCTCLCLQLCILTYGRLYTVADKGYLEYFPVMWWVTNLVTPVVHATGSSLIDEQAVSRQQTFDKGLKKSHPSTCPSLCPCGSSTAPQLLG